VGKRASVDGTDKRLTKTLTALLLIQLGGMKQRDQVRLLDRAGFGQAEIAQILNSTPKTISVRLAEIRKATRKRGGKDD